MNSRVFLFPGFRHYVLFTAEVLDHMYAYTQRRPWHREAGGEVYTPDHNTNSTVITAATGPNLGDHRKRHAFNPDVEAVTRDRNKMFVQGLHAVGLWHTHPEAQPVPSELDHKTTEKYLEAFQGDRDFYLLIILGNRGTPPAMVVWSVEYNYLSKLVELM